MNADIERLSSGAQLSFMIRPDMCEFWSKSETMQLSNDNDYNVIYEELGRYMKSIWYSIKKKHGGGEVYVSLSAQKLFFWSSSTRSIHCNSPNEKSPDSQAKEK